MSDHRQPPPGWYPWSPTLNRYWDGAQWTEDTRPLPWGPAAEQLYLRPQLKWHQRRWVRRGLGFGAFLIVATIVGTIEEQKRSETDLGARQNGSQQEWVEYFERSNDPVDQLNQAVTTELTNTSLTAILEALRQLADSPDAPLNYTVERAIEACESLNTDACARSLDTVADGYNAALTEAEADGLLEVSE